MVCCSEALERLVEAFEESVCGLDVARLGGEKEQVDEEVAAEDQLGSRV